MTQRPPSVWRIALDQPPATVSRLHGLLDLRERWRAQQLASPADRRRYIVAHGAARSVLGGLCDCPPGLLAVRREPDGRPRLTAAARPGHPPGGLPDFNLSHTDGWALLGVAWDGCRIGVDVERVREDLDLSGVARRFFQPHEVRLINSSPPTDRPREFFRLWTLKEAFLKAHGRRVGELAEVTGDVPGEPGGPGALRLAPDGTLTATGWEVPAPAGHSAAVAIAGGPATRPMYTAWSEDISTDEAPTARQDRDATDR
ncbi:4'-phosphopantetheinyl transferase family protein [Streptomyces sp. NPDC102441]|uniref:4'-phosphopantetheinyl transferase family protein n=1 Tax=Streptomyces sp. NPDC102441 TaxID=3366176 RepID=UPI0037FF721B